MSEQQSDLDGIEDDLLADSERAPSDGEIVTITRLANRIIHLDGVIELLEANLKKRQEERKLISEVQLPELMTQVGVMSFRLEDGSSVEVANKILASISKDRKEEALAWLRDNGHGDLLKNEVSAAFDRGMEEQARQALTALSQFSNSATMESSIHYQTLGKLVRELLEAGAPVDMELLGVYNKRETKIVPPKKGKK